MTKSKNGNNMNLIPVAIILVLIFVAGFLLLKDSIRLPWVRKDSTIEVKRLSNFPTSFGSNDLRELYFLV